MTRLAFLTVAVVTTVAACHWPDRAPTFVMIRADRTVSPSAFPPAVDPSRVGTYPEETKSGAGYFYDDVLEYRVWFHPEHGAIPFNGATDYFMTFSTYEPAEAVSKTLPGGEKPLVLIRQLESINEPEPGRHIHDSEPVSQNGKYVGSQEVNALRRAFRNSCNIPAPQGTKPAASEPQASLLALEVPNGTPRT